MAGVKALVKGRSAIIARPLVATLEDQDGAVVGHPPSGPDSDLSAFFYLCRLYDVDEKTPDSAYNLALALAREYRPEAFTAAGRANLTPDERRMSIAWIVDMHATVGMKLSDAIEEARAALKEYGYEEADHAASTLLKLVKEGNKVLEERGLRPHHVRKSGRPRKK